MTKLDSTVNQTAIWGQSDKKAIRERKTKEQRPTAFVDKEEEEKNIRETMPGKDNARDLDLKKY